MSRCATRCRAIERFRRTPQPWGGLAWAGVFLAAVAWVLVCGDID